MVKGFDPENILLLLLNNLKPDNKIIEEKDLKK